MPFRKYRLQNTCLRKCLKSHVSVHPRTVNMLNRLKFCCNLHGSSFINQFYQFSSSLFGNFSYKKPFLVICEILRPFFNTLTSDREYFPGNRENLPEPSQIQLSNKLKTFFSELSTSFAKYIFNFEHLEQKDESHSFCVSKSIDCKIRAFVNV